jgi:hypothetical protein
MLHVPRSDLKAAADALKPSVLGERLRRGPSLIFGVPEIEADDHAGGKVLCSSDGE